MPDLPLASSRPELSVPSGPRSESFPIFLVEDSDDDLFLFRRLLKKAEIAHPFGLATNGQDAIEQLSTIMGKGEEAAIPRLVFLDLKLPLRSGFEVLEWIRSQPAFATSAVIVLSSSAEIRDVKRAYDLGAQGYLVKYPAAAVFRQLVDEVHRAGPKPDLARLSLSGVQRP